MVKIKNFFGRALIFIAIFTLVSCAYMPKFLTVPERQEVTTANYVRAQNSVKPIGEVLMKSIGS